MHNNLNTSPTAQNAPAHKKPDATQQLESARSRVRAVQRDIQIAEGRFLDFDTAEEISRTLSTIMRDLEAVQLQVAVMSRKGGTR